MIHSIGTLVEALNELSDGGSSPQERQAEMELNDAINELKELRELLTDALNEGFAQHTLNCVGGFYEDSAGEKPYICLCGYKEWLVEAKKVQP